MYNWTDDIEYVSGARRSDRAWSGSMDPEEAVAIMSRHIVESNGRDWYADPDSAVDAEIGDLSMGGASTLWSIPCSSKLYELLRLWYGDDETMMGSIRSALYLEECDCLLFVTGGGYATLSQDLLGGTADGRAFEEFDAFVDEQMA